MKKIILILIILVAINTVCAVPQIPVQVYGDITPTLTEEYPMSFKIEGIEYETGVVKDSKYGYEPLVLIPVDDPATAEKEGYEHGVDVVFVYINDVKVDEQTYPASVNRIDIALTEEQLNKIKGVSEKAPPEEELPAPRRGGAGCFSRWNCTEWSPCSVEGIQTRLCKDTGTCRRPDKVEEQVCTYIPPEIPEEKIPVIKEEVPEEEFIGFEEPPEKGGRALLILLLIVVIAGGLGFVFYEWEKSRRKLMQEMAGKKIEEPSLKRLRSYIEQTQQEGYTKEQIRQALLREGWSPSIIKQVLK